MFLPSCEDVSKWKWYQGELVVRTFFEIVIHFLALGEFTELPSLSNSNRPTLKVIYGVDYSIVYVDDILV